MLPPSGNRSTARQRSPDSYSSLCRPLCRPCKSGSSLRTSVSSSSHMQLCWIRKFPPANTSPRKSSSCKKLSLNGSLEFGYDMHEENWGGSTVPRASITDHAGTPACDRYSMQGPSIPRPQFLFLSVCDLLNGLWGLSLGLLSARRTNRICLPCHVLPSFSFTKIVETIPSLEMFQKAS